MYKFIMPLPTIVGGELHVFRLCIVRPPINTYFAWCYISVLSARLWWNLAEIFVTWVGTAGQRSRHNRIIVKRKVETNGPKQLKRSIAHYVCRVIKKLKPTKLLISNDVSASFATEVYITTVKCLCLSCMTCIQCSYMTVCFFASENLASWWYWAIELWNSRPDVVKSATSLTVFRQKLKTHYFGSHTQSSGHTM